MNTFITALIQINSIIPRVYWGEYPTLITMLRRAVLLANGLTWNIYAMWVQLQFDNVVTSLMYAFNQCCLTNDIMDYTKEKWTNLKVLHQNLMIYHSTGAYESRKLFSVPLNSLSESPIHFTQKIGVRTFTIR